MSERLLPTQLTPRERKRQAAFASAEAQVEKFRSEMLEFVARIARTGHRPENWPLNQQEQIAFIRQAVGDAQKLHSSEMFFIEDMRLKAKEFGI